MSIRHLDSLFSPESVAVFGASEREGRVGSTVWRNLLATFPGRLYPVNPKHRSLGGVTAYGRVKDLPEAPELAVICTPAASVPGLIAELAERGTGRRSELRKGFLVGASNPKTIVFFIAALPQFVDHGRGNVLLQMLVLLLVYGVMGWIADTMWGVAGSSVRSWAATAPHRIERLIGGGGLCIIGVGAWLALSHGVA